MSFPTYDDFQRDFNFVLAKKIDEGSFGQVFKVPSLISINHHPLQDYAVKFVETPKYLLNNC